MSRQNFIRNLIFSALFTALICIGAFIKIDFFIPITLQLFFVILSSLTQKPKYAAVSVGLYITIGILGVPVFSGGGGFAYVLKPSFGFVLGFFPSVAIALLLLKRSKKRARDFVLCAIVCVAAVYIVGVPYGFIVTNAFTDSMGFSSLIVINYLIMIPADILKALLAAYIAIRITKIQPL